MKIRGEIRKIIVINKKINRELSLTNTSIASAYDVKLPGFHSLISKNKILESFPDIK